MRTNTKGKNANSQMISYVYIIEYLQAYNNDFYTIIVLTISVFAINIFIDFRFFFSPC